MKQIVRTIGVGRSAADAWRLVSDLSRYDEVIVGVRRWEPAGDGRYWILMQVGAVPTGGEVRVTVDHDAHEVEWTSLRGTRHDARLKVDGISHDTCRIVFELRFDLVGLAAPLTELLAGPILRRNLEASLESARHLIEFDMEVPS
jgi:carbon monoxide dehydrogenase subunit G